MALGNLAQGALGGAGTGASLGSFIPGIGTLAGAGIGAGLGLLGGYLGGRGSQPSGVNSGGYGQQQNRGFLDKLKEFFAGHPEIIQQIEQFSPQQLQALQLALSQGSSILQDPYAGFDPIENYARSQFAQKTVPSLAERFTSMGQNSMSSPAFASQLSSAGAGLDEALAAMRAQYGMQNRAQGLSMLGLGLTPRYAMYQQGGQPGMLQSVLPTLGKIATQAGLGYLGAGNKEGEALAGVKSALNKLL